jgi:hypothetical protein
MPHITEYSYQIDLTSLEPRQPRVNTLWALCETARKQDQTMTIIPYGREPQVVHQSFADRLYESRLISR